MQIQEKIAVSRRQNRVALIEEGMFFRVYNESAYIVTERLQQSLKITRKSIKKLGDLPIAYIGFPKAQLFLRFPTAIKTTFGFEVIGRYDLSGYSAWLKGENAPLWQNAMTESGARALAASAVDACALGAQNSSNNDFTFTEQQRTFLLSWQKDKYARAIDSAFIQELKESLEKSS